MPMLLISLPSDEPIRVLRPHLPNGFNHFLGYALSGAAGVLPVGRFDAGQVFHVLEPTMAIRHKIYQFGDSMLHIYWLKMIHRVKFALLIGFGQCRSGCNELELSRISPRQQKKLQRTACFSNTWLGEQNSRSKAENSTTACRGKGPLCPHKGNQGRRRVRAGGRRRHSHSHYRPCGLFVWRTLLVT